jgi:erythromycin esterase-like protein
MGGRARSTPLAAAVLAALPLTAGAQEGLSRTDQRFVDWARQHAIALETLDWHQADLTELAALEPLLAGKRIVLIGEADHFVHEKNDVRALLIRFLAGRGFRHVGMEMGFSDALRMDRFVETGDPGHLERIAIHGYEGDRRTDRRDGVAGFSEDRDPDLLERVNSESRWCLEQLREIRNALGPDAPRLHWFGYDVSFAPGGGYVDVTERLEPVRDRPVVAELLGRLALVQGESRDAERERLEDVLRRIELGQTELEECLGAEVLKEVRRGIQNLVDSLAWIQASGSERFGPEWLAGLAERERCMMRTLDERIAELPPGEGLILLGHDLHLSKDSTKLRYGPAPMWTSIGTHLAQRFGDEVLGFWMLHHDGRHGVPRSVEEGAPFEDLPGRPGSIESLLANVGPLFLLPLRPAGGLDRTLERPRSCLGGTRAVLPDQTDVLFFVRTVSEPQVR